MLIGVIVCGIVEEYAINLIQSIEHMSRKNDVKCVAIPIRFIGIDFERLLDNKYAYCYNASAFYGLLSCFDGLIIETASVLMYASDEIKQKFISLFKDVPHVFIGRNIDNSFCVTIDNQVGLVDALDYLYDNGATKFAMMGGPSNNSDALDRKLCFENFLKSHNLQYSEKSYQSGSFFLPCDEEAEQLIIDNKDAEVFVCANDFLAKQMYRSLRKFNKRPGRDVSVLGFDDSQTCTTTYPSISSVRTDIVEVGKVSFELLMEAIDKKPVRHATVPSKFILRDSICYHTESKTKEIAEYHFKDIIKSNIVYENNQYLEILEKIIDEVNSAYDLYNKDDDKSLDSVISMMGNKLDELFSCEGLDLIDWDVFSSINNDKYRNWMNQLSKKEDRKKVTDLFIRFHEMVMKVNNYVSPEKLRLDYVQNVGMERFFRETMQYVRNAEANYTRFIKNVDFLGIKNAFLYIYDEPIYYIYGESLDIPEYANLKAYLKDGEPISVPFKKQRMKREAIFDNKILNWKNYKNLMLFPVYSDNIIYGLLLCDIKRVGYEQSDLFMNQLGSGIRMMNLRIENKRILDNFEESVRTLREYNVTLDNMSKTDSLTGLNNRRGLTMRANKLLEMFPNDSTSLLVGYVDMNDLKIVNDRFGHDDGDFALKTIGTMLTNFVTNYNGFGARIGGDEFAFIILVPSQSDDNIYREELYGMFDEFNKNSIKPYYIEVSIGSYLYEKGETLSIDDALHQADERLYYEKNTRKRISVIKDV